jgi:hypothetical protein
VKINNKTPYIKQFFNVVSVKMLGEKTSNDRPQITVHKWWLRITGGRLLKANGKKVLAISINEI